MGARKEKTSVVRAALIRRRRSVHAIPLNCVELSVINWEMMFEKTSNPRGKPSRFPEELDVVYHTSGGLYT